MTQAAGTSKITGPGIKKHEEIAAWYQRSRKNCGAAISANEKHVSGKKLKKMFVILIKTAGMMTTANNSAPTFHYKEENNGIEYT